MPIIVKKPSPRDLRDITSDLKVRMDLAEERIDRAKERYSEQCKAAQAEFDRELAEAKAEYKAAAALRESELRRMGVAPEAPDAPTQPLDEFLIQTVEKFGTAGKGNLRNEAEHAGYFTKGESPGRVIHTTLLHIVRANRLRQVGPDVYAPAFKPGELALTKGSFSP